LIDTTGSVYEVQTNRTFLYALQFVLNICADFFLALFGLLTILCFVSENACSARVKFLYGLLLVKINDLRHQVHLWFKGVEP